MQNIIESLIQNKVRHFGSEYLNELIGLLKTLSEPEHYRKGLKLKELLEFDTLNDKEMKFAITEPWLIENSVDFGRNCLIKE